MSRVSHGVQLRCSKPRERVAGTFVRSRARRSLMPVVSLQKMTRRVKLAPAGKSSCQDRGVASSLAARAGAGGCMLAATARISRSCLFVSIGFVNRRAVARAHRARSLHRSQAMMMDSGEEEGSSGEELSKSPDYEKLRLLVPDLDSSKFHKGQAGKIGVVGGCEEYTGAPYFAAMSALRMGADLAHVFCAEGAGHVIKSYSPELIVHPYMREGGSGSNGGTHTAYDAELVTEAMEKIEPWLDRMSVLVVGPGLGRDPTMCETAKRIIAAACEKDIPLVIDADGIRLVMEDEDVSLVGNNGRVVLTPNKAELDRFRGCGWGGESGNSGDIASDIAHILNGPVVVAKGEADVVVTHTIGEVEDMLENAHLEGYENEIAKLRKYSTLYVCDEMGSPRRCGGQGDVLAGTIATFLAWSTRSEAAECAIVSAAMHLEDDPDTEAALSKAAMAQNYKLNHVFASSASALAAYAGCLVTRVAARAAFDKKRRSMLATDVIEELGDTMQRLFPVEIETDI